MDNALNTDLDKRNIRYGYNSTSMMEFFREKGIIHQLDMNILGKGGEGGVENHW